ncbi:hypothetical protein CPB83DRAFT_841387 [Crepidotus variabilis]|uniref:Uncharacterized protein n=1 Tax=Crepidotus variabilis TaxID=179855 RepID=A0A9P6BBD3_9AGAR|nr:hypothetical protein CPB83DRAFT_841387 [Crepidotus variabilis]
MFRAARRIRQRGHKFSAVSERKIEKYSISDIEPLHFPLHVSTTCIVVTFNHLFYPPKPSNLIPTQTSAHQQLAAIRFIWLSTLNDYEKRDWLRFELDGRWMGRREVGWQVDNQYPVCLDGSTPMPLKSTSRCSDSRLALNAIAQPVGAPTKSLEISLYNHSELHGEFN